jgi:hypothetical protein
MPPKPSPLDLLKRDEFKSPPPSKGPSMDSDLDDDEDDLDDFKIPSTKIHNWGELLTSDEDEDEADSDDDMDDDYL